MEEWKEYKLGDLGEVIGGATPSTKNISYYDGNIPWITPKDLSNYYDRYISYGERMISEEGFKSCSCKILPKGSVLFSSRAPIGYVAIAANDLCTNQGFKSIIPNTKVIDSEFLYYLLVYNKSRIEAMGSGTTFKEVSGNVMRNVTVFIPNLQSQKSIASILSSLDDKIELNRRINENLEQQAQALFKSWFVDFEPFKDGKFVNSELGRIPEGWKVGTLSDIANVTMGQSPKGTSYNENGEGIIFYQGRADFGSRYPSIRLFTTEPTRYAEPLSVLLSVRAPVGDINLAVEKCCIGRGLASIYSKTGHQSFVLYTMFSLKKELDKFNSEGTVFGSINRSSIENLKIIIPPMNIIQKFDSLVRSLDIKLFDLFKETERLKEIRDTLLPKLMSGELKLSEIETKLDE